MMKTLGLAILLFCSSRASALVPDQLNYQGRILSLTAGTVLPDSASNSATFRIFNALSGGVQVWSETQTNIATSKGLFNVVLGAVVPLSGVAFDVPYWLEVTWNNGGTAEVMSPRQPLTSSPYAFRAKQLQMPFADNTALNGNSNIFVSNGGSGGGTTAIQGSCFACIGLLGTGLTGTAGSASAANGIGVVANQGPGALALRVLGDAAFEAGSTTYFKGAVSFTGGTNLTSTAPLSLTNASSVTTLSAYNNLGGSGGSAILGVSSGNGTAGAIGRNDASSTGALGVYGEAQAGRGVFGQSSTGVGIYGLSSSGIAIEALGALIGLSVSTSSAVGQAAYMAGNSSGDMVRIDQGGGGAGLVAVAQTGNGVDGYSYGTGTSYGVRGLLAGAGNGGAGIQGWAYGTSNNGAGVLGSNDSLLGIGIKAAHSQASQLGSPAIALDVDGGIQVKARTDAPAGQQNVGTPNLVGGVNPYRFGNGNIVSNQIRSSSIILLTPQCALCSNNLDISVKLSTIVDGQANYSVIAEKSDGTDPGFQNVTVHYLIINQR